MDFNFVWIDFEWQIRNAGSKQTTSGRTGKVNARVCVRTAFQRLLWVQVPHHKPLTFTACSQSNLQFSSRLRTGDKFNHKVATRLFRRERGTAKFHPRWAVCHSQSHLPFSSKNIRQTFEIGRIAYQMSSNRIPINHSTHKYTIKRLAPKMLSNKMQFKKNVSKTRGDGVASMLNREINTLYGSVIGERLKCDNTISFHIKKNETRRISAASYDGATVCFWHTHNRTGTHTRTNDGRPRQAHRTDDSTKRKRNENGWQYGTVCAYVLVLKWG